VDRVSNTSKAARKTLNIILDKPATLAALADAEGAVAAFFGGLPDDELAARVDDAWTPGEHLAHLNTSVSAAARGFGISRLLLRLRFGKARAPSRSYEDLRDHYRARLSGGGRASGGFVPERMELTGSRISAHRHDLLARWHRVNTRLRDAVEPWSEQNLETLQMPHPLLGKLTAREILFFTIYHNHHHIAGAQSRLPVR
jgi:hypothetical protein